MAEREGFEREEGKAVGELSFLLFGGSDSQTRTKKEGPWPFLDS